MLVKFFGSRIIVLRQDSGGQQGGNRMSASDTPTYAAVSKVSPRLASQPANVRVDGDAPVSERRALVENNHGLLLEIEARRQVIEQVVILATLIEDTGYRRASAMLLEVADSIERVLIIDRVLNG